jgi:hypothetical protein
MSLLRHLLGEVYNNCYRSSHGYGDRGHKHQDHRHGYSHPKTIGVILPFVGRLLNKRRKLLWVLAGLAVFTLLVMAAFAVALAPLFSQLIDYLYHNGLKGVVDILSSLIDRIWEGAGK